MHITLKFVISVSELKKDLCTNDFAEIPNYSTCSNLFKLKKKKKNHHNLPNHPWAYFYHIRPQQPNATLTLF